MISSPHLLRARLRCGVFLVSLLVGCSAAPRGKVPDSCSGVPGDFRTPNASLDAGHATNGEGTEGQPVELKAIARPPGNIIPLLYIYGPDAEYVVGNHPYSKILSDSAFTQVASEAYWGEAADGRYYQIPWLDKCSQAAMLDTGISFRAPPKGILFMQFLAPSCEECDRITKAIEGFISQNPTMPVRWVRVTVPRSVGTLSE